MLPDGMSRQGGTADAGLSDDDADAERTPAATGNLKYTAHGFDELSLMVSMKTCFISGASRSMSGPSGEW